jgi:elongation factor P
MASIKMIDVRRGMVLNMNSQLWYCLDRDLNTPGNWRAILYLKLKNLKTGSITDERVHPDDKVDIVYLDTRDFTYSYKDGDDYVFMDAETWARRSTTCGRTTPARSPCTTARRSTWRCRRRWP